RGAVDILQRPVARLAPREGLTASSSLEGSRPSRPGHRAPGTLRRPIPCFDPEDGAEGPGEADPDRAPGEGTCKGQGRGRSAHAQDEKPRLRVPEACSQRP